MLKRIGSSCWICRETKKLSIDTIYHWMGDFSKETNLAKYASRMGLAFSTTYFAARIDKSCVRQIPDVKRTVRVRYEKENREEDVEYCFSDGVGTISESLIRRSVKVLHEEYASAIQCRFGGCKGVFSIDPKLSGDTICIRPSQSKFVSQQTDVEIIGCSRFHYGHLNRQVILLLSTLKVPDKVFLELLDRHVQMLQDLIHGSATDDVQETALEGCFQEVADVVQRMTKHSFTPKNEPFLQTINKAIFCRSLKELRTRERILIKRSGCLLGVMDETGTLEYGQVFCRLSKSNDPKAPSCDEDLKDGNFTVTGDVVISKNPCLFPGDIRVLQAVDAKNLYHYINVVVFPSKGPRPHPNETSGSDLDGDVYFISWEKSLLPRKEDRVEPAQFPSSKGDKAKITRENIINFFSNYLKGSKLGRIANAHLIIADRADLKALDPQCLYLAAQHSIEVDFPKTGVSGNLREEDSVKEYPDFMEKENDLNTYESKSIMGTIYRKVRDIQNSYNIQDQEGFEGVVELDRDLLVEGCEKYFGVAENNYRQYVADMNELMRQYGIKTEAELISGNITELSKYHTVKKDNNDILDRIANTLTIRIQKHKKIFDNGVKTPEEKLPKAAAYYVVAYDIKGEYRNARRYGPNRATGILHRPKASPGEELKVPPEEAKKPEAKAAEVSGTASKGVVRPDGKKKMKNQCFFSFPWLIAGRQLCQIKSKQ